MRRKLRDFQIFAKPVGASCNLRCSYCYYLGKKDLYPATRSFVMSEELLEKYIIQHIEASTDQVIMFSWHGGEPMLAGIDFYKKAINLQQKYMPAGRTIINGIQTNGTLIDDNWARFFASENFVLGLSIDGTEEFHNKHRRTGLHTTTFRQVMNGFEVLRQHGVIPEILCVLSSFNAGSPGVIYNFFRKLEVNYITFLPLVLPQPDSITGVSPDSVPAEEFGKFLICVFDEWIEKDIGRMKIQIFEEAARTAFNQEHTLCIFKVNCGGVPVVEHNGDFYSCDHYVDEEHLIGNIKDRSLTNFLDCSKQKAFGKAKSSTLPDYCSQCSVKPMCNGECPKNRFIKTPDGESGLNYLCSGYKLFFTHCQPFIEAIRIAWENQIPVR
jgi:uncharacterized protein